MSTVTHPMPYNQKVVGARMQTLAMFPEPRILTPMIKSINKSGKIKREKKEQREDIFAKI
jgi:hypothetical protein